MPIPITNDHDGDVARLVDDVTDDVYDLMMSGACTIPMLIPITNAYVRGMHNIYKNTNNNNNNH